MTMQQLLLLLLLLLVLVINCKDIHVNQYNGKDTNNGTSIHTAVKTIQHAVDIANPSDTILLSRGIHSLYREVFISKDNLTIQSLEANEEDPFSMNEEQLAVIVAFRIIGQVLFIHHSNYVKIRFVVLRDATVWNLLETRPELEMPCGGGLMISSSNHTMVESVKMINNVAAQGGALCILNSNNVTVNRCEFIKNSAVIRNNVLHQQLNELRINRVSNFDIENSDFFGNIPLYKNPPNSPILGKGGAIAVLQSFGVVINESVISNNTAADEGGAIYSAGSEIYLERSSINRNVGYRQSSTIYSDIASDIYMNKIYFFENFCVHSQCRLIYSEKRALLQDKTVFRVYVFPIVCFTGAVFSVILLFVIPLIRFIMYCYSYVQYRRRQKEKDVQEKRARLIRSDRVVMWVMESFAVSYPDGTNIIWICIHRSMVVLVIVLSVAYSSISYTSTFPLYYDEFDRIESVFYTMEHIYYYVIPLGAFIGTVIAARRVAPKLFSSTYSKSFESSFDKETEKQLLLMTGHQVEEEMEMFHTNSRKRYNRRAMIACFWAFLYANIMYAIVVVDVFHFVQQQQNISNLTNENVAFDTSIVSIFSTLHWYLNFCIISLMLCVLYLICNRINALTRLYFDELHHKLKTGTFTLQWGIEGL
jgi:hypothetical protein